jgi:hypothetical protein
VDGMVTSVVLGQLAVDGFTHWSGIVSGQICNWFLPRYFGLPERRAPVFVYEAYLQ